MPGSYRVGGFLDELQKRPNTYSFRDSSRAKSASHQRFAKTGETLLPGAYDCTGFVQHLEAKHMTYGFKGTDREQGPKIGHTCPDKVHVHANTELASKDVDFYYLPYSSLN